LAEEKGEADTDKEDTKRFLLRWDLQPFSSEQYKGIVIS